MEDLLSALAAATVRTTSAPIELLPGSTAEPPRWIARTDLSERAARLGREHGEHVAAVVRTSGSTGTPKETLLSAEALEASARATAEHLGGHGQWLLTLQPSYVAGLAVLSRSLIAGTVPVPLLEGSADPRVFAEAAAAMTAERRYVSLVPTQLVRLLEGEEPGAVEALRRFDAILLGGGASSPRLLDRAAHLGLHVVRTYGMAETCGGCVYDGRPLPGISIAADSPDDGPGTISLSGPTVALGYSDPRLTADRFDRDEHGRRRFRTDDLGLLETEGIDGPRLRVTGRSDDVIISGGVKISAEAVRQALLADDAVVEAFVGPAPDPQWGQRVCAAVVLRAGLTELPRSASDRLRADLGAAAAPRSVHVLESVPLLSTGKPDRRRLLALFAEAES
ncbi:MAG: AMP-binding protein [Nesterenkonia sp.]|nr:AMP-binding protein [Nesterenkonia sp.]